MAQRGFIGLEPARGRFAQTQVAFDLAPEGRDVRFGLVPRLSFRSACQNPIMAAQRADGGGFTGKLPEPLRSNCRVGEDGIEVHDAERRLRIGEDQAESVRNLLPLSGNLLFRVDPLGRDVGNGFGECGDALDHRLGLLLRLDGG